VVVDTTDSNVDARAHEILGEIYDLHGADKVSLDLRVLNRPHYEQLQRPEGFVTIWSKEVPTPVR
jgi:hypothetical protein